MFCVRNARLEDLEDIYKLSELETLINLPHDRDYLTHVITNSLESFAQPQRERTQNHYFFVIEDCEHSQVVGVSLIHGQHGTYEMPHFFFRICHETKSYPPLNAKISHKVLVLDFEIHGYSEVGGLILHPQYRKTPYKLGKQLSLARFLYIARHRESFTDIIHTELLPSINPKGEPPLWEAFGKKFTQMSYREADHTTRTDKEFIIALFPWGEKIYEALLPKDAQEAIGQVGPNTAPAKAMLKKIGFQYTEEIDPFDGGPHYRCPRDDILPVKQARSVKIKHSENTTPAQPYLVQLEQKDCHFYCIQVIGTLTEETHTLHLSSSLAKQYNIKNGQEAFCTPI